MAKKPAKPKKRKNPNPMPIRPMSVEEYKAMLKGVTPEGWG